MSAKIGTEPPLQYVRNADTARGIFQRISAFLSDRILREIVWPPPFSVVVSINTIDDLCGVHHQREPPSW